MGWQEQLRAAVARATTTEEGGRFGTFSGVYRPVFLTILGALLYLREGWLVANAGLGGALLVIAAAYLITGTTAMSLSSIATNGRVKAGGAFAIIAAALGLEAGGAIGIPLYIAQTVSSVMYLYAFTEGWMYLFPNHRAGIVVTLAFLGVGGLVLRSAALAFKAQAVMLFVVIAAIASAFLGWSNGLPYQPAILGRFPDASLLECFALFFPAATGIMVGVGMSGSLDDPRRAVPRGTLGAWGTTLVIYAAAAVWYGTVASREELLANKLAMVDHALFGPLVLFGLLSSTLMAALSSLVAAPRLLAAMAELRVVPFADRLSVTTAAGEPRNAALATLGIAAIGLLAGSLDAIAPIITSFFIMTYLAVNVVVFVEQWLKLVSWRPTFEIRTWVPAVGAVACLLGLVLSSPAGGLPEVTFVGGIWLWLTRRRHVETPWETVQSGIAQDVAAWAVLRASQLKRSERSWKPDLMIPVSSADEVAVLAPLAEALTETRGSVRWIMLRQDGGLEERVRTSTRQLEAEDVLCSSHEMVEDAPGQGLRLAIHAMKGTLFAPNLVLFSARHQDPSLLLTSLDLAKQQELGAVLALDDARRPFGPTGTVTVWLSDRSPSWELGLHVTNLDLPVLIAWLLTRRQKGRIRLATVLRDEEQRPAATAFLEDLVELGRLANTTIHVLGGTIDERLRDAPPSDLHVLGMPEKVDLARLEQLREAAQAPCLFVRDSGHESALA